MSNNIESIEKGLLGGKYTEALYGLRRLGLSFKRDWDKPLKETGKIPESYQFTSNPEFKEFLIKKLLEDTNESSESSFSNQVSVENLQKLLFTQAIFITAWKDKLNEDNTNNDPNTLEVLSSLEPESNLNQKRSRKEIRYKEPLDKHDRYPINIGLQAMVYELCKLSDKFIENNGWVETFKQSESKADLLKLLFSRIEKLNEKFPISATNSSKEKVKKEIGKIGTAIKAFQTPTKKKKLLKYFGVSLAFIAALACGFATGGAIYLLVPSLPILGMILGGVIGLWGFSANYGFFSQNFPDFLITLFKKGGLSEYLDQEGKRQQLSRTKKYVFIPLAVIASITVGLGTSAITYTTVIALAAKLVPVLAIIWPPLPVIIVGILAAAIGITLTVAVLTATIKSIKESGNFSWAQCKETLKNLTAREIAGYLVKGLIVLAGLFGLAYFRYTAGIDLTQLLQPLVGSAATIVSGAMGLLAYVPQAFFTVVSIQKLIRVISPKTSQQVISVDEDVAPPSFFSRIKSGFITFYTWLALIGNALGNAALVVVDSVSALSISGAVGGFFNSLSGNLIEPDRNVPYRNQANTDLANEFNTMSTKAKPSTSEPLSNGLNLQQPQPLLSNISSTTKQGDKQPSNKSASRFERHHSSPDNPYNSDAEENPSVVVTPESQSSSSPNDAKSPVPAIFSGVTNNASFYKLPDVPSNDRMADPKEDPKPAAAI